MGIDRTRARIFSAGDCPVDFDTGAAILLKARPSGKFFLFCPICGLAWLEPPLALNEMRGLRDFAPEGADLPSEEEAHNAGFAVTDITRDFWWDYLESVIV